MTDRDDVLRSRLGEIMPLDELTVPLRDYQRLEAELAKARDELLGGRQVAAEAAVWVSNDAPDGSYAAELLSHLRAFAESGESNYADVTAHLRRELAKAREAFEAIMLIPPYGNEEGLSRCQAIAAAYLAGGNDADT